MQRFKEVVGSNFPFVGVPRILLASPFGLYYSQSIDCGSMRSGNPNSSFQGRTALWLNPYRQKKSVNR